MRMCRVLTFFELVLVFRVHDQRAFSELDAHRKATQKHRRNTQRYETCVNASENAENIIYIFKCVHLPEVFGEL